MTGDIDRRGMNFIPRSQCHSTEEREGYIMLRWDFNEKCGKIVHHNGDIRDWYEGNALMIVLSEWAEDDGKQYYSLYEFFIDKDHMKNCFGLTKGYDNIYKGEEWQELTINMAHCHNWKVIIDLVTKVMPNCKITLYRSEK